MIGRRLLCWADGTSSSCLFHLEHLKKHFWTELYQTQTCLFAVMIPTKMLVYRGADGGTVSGTVTNTRRRKKSTGELFQKGYRVRMGHGQVSEKEDQGLCHSIGSCLHVISYWGKTCRTREHGKSQRWWWWWWWCVLVFLDSIWKSGSGIEIYGFLSSEEILRWNKNLRLGSQVFFPNIHKYTWLQLDGGCDTFDLCSWLLHKFTSAGKFMCQINACEDGFDVIAHSWLKRPFVVYVPLTLLPIQVFVHMRSSRESSGF